MARRVGLLGHSRGGSQALALALTDPRVRAGRRVLYRGVSLERLIEQLKLIGKRCETSVFNHPF